MTLLMPEGPQRDEAHRAIGRYVTEFSRLISGMRDAIEWRLVGKDRTLAQLALGEATASQITNAFFAICEHLADLDDEERQVSIRLKKEAVDAIKERNDFAHGDWLLARGEGGEELRGPTLIRTKPGRKQGPRSEQVRPVEELDALSDDLEVLTEFIDEFAYLCFGIHPLAIRWGQEVRIRDIVRFRKHEVLRVGRYADETIYASDAYEDPLPASSDSRSHSASISASASSISSRSSARRSSPSGSAESLSGSRSGL